jgi:orsellinic acid C2-O-methyltransferase
MAESAQSSRDSAAMADSLLDMIGASWMSQAICVAAELNLPDLLAEQSQTVDQLADATHCSHDALHRLLRGLASLGICIEQEDSSFALTPMGALLCSNASAGVRSWAIWWGRYLWPKWHDLLSCIKAGKSARELATGSKGYAHLEADEAAAQIFNCAMVEQTRYVSREVLRAYDFSEARRVVDIGGGHGALLTALLEAYPAMHGVIIDRAYAIDGANAGIASAGVVSRCEFEAGDFFESIPSGADIYLLKSILHNWNDERAAVILSKCRRAMSDKARLLIIERTMPARIRDTARERAFARTDLNMLVGLGGRERTEAQFRALFSAAGFKLMQIIPAGRELSIIEGAPS